MQRESERYFGDLKVIILTTESDIDTREVRSFFCKNGFYLLKSSEYKITLFGEPEKFQKIVGNCPFGFNLRKIRNKRFYEKIYE